MHNLRSEIVHTILCNMLCCMTHNLHTYVINSFGKSLRELFPKDADLHIALKKLPRSWVKMITFEKLTKQYYPIHALHLRASTEKLLQNHRTGHPFYQYLYNAQKYIGGVSNFSDTTSKAIDQCTNCIHTNMSKLHLARVPLVFPHKNIKAC